MGLTTKYKLCEQSQRLILGGQPTQDREILIQELVVMLEQAFATVIRRRYFESKNMGEPYINGNFIFPFSITVNKDTTGYYLEIPETSVSLPNDIQIYSVYGKAGTSYIPVAVGFDEMFKGLDAGELEGKAGYYIEGSKIRFSNMNARNKPESINVRIVAPTGDVGLEDSMSIPEDIQLEIVTMTVQLYSVQQQGEKDEISDLNK